MDTAAITTIVSHMKQRPFYTVLKAMLTNHFIELKSARWSIDVDGQPYGRCILCHDLVVDDVLGVAYESWAWTQKGQARVLHLSSDRDGLLSVAVDGFEVKGPTLEIETQTNGDHEQTFLIIHVRYEDHHFQFEGLLE